MAQIVNPSPSDLAKIGQPGLRQWAVDSAGSSIRIYFAPDERAKTGA